MYMYMHYLSLCSPWYKTGYFRPMPHSTLPDCTTQYLHVHVYNRTPFYVNATHMCIQCLTSNQKVLGSNPSWILSFFRIL